MGRELSTFRSLGAHVTSRPPNLLENVKSNVMQTKNSNWLLGFDLAKNITKETH